MTDQPATGAAPGDTHAPGTDADGSPSTDRPKLARGHGSRKVLAGVCDGAGRYFEVDPVIFRIVLVVLSLTGGIGLIIYGMGWLVIPQEGESESEAHRLLSGRIEGAPLTAVLMALVGCGLYASTIGNGTNQAFSVLLLAGTIGAVYWSQQRKKLPEAVSPEVASVVADAPPAVQAPPEPGGSASWWREPLTKEPPYLWGPDDGPYGEQDRAAWRQRKREVRRQEHDSWPFGLGVFLCAVTAAAVGVGVSWPREPVGTSVEIGLSATLGVLGAAFVIASFAGRARGGTVFFSLLTIAGLIVAAALPKTGHGVGGATWRPATTAALLPVYERGTGTGTLDLTGLALGGRTVSTQLRLGAGQAVVKLPTDAVIRLDYDLGLGQAELPGPQGEDGDGMHHLQHNQHTSLTYQPVTGAEPAGTIDLEVNIGVGRLKVIR